MTACRRFTAGGHLGSIFSGGRRDGHRMPPPPPPTKFGLAKFLKGTVGGERKVGAGGSWPIVVTGLRLPVWTLEEPCFRPSQGVRGERTCINRCCSVANAAAAAAACSCSPVSLAMGTRCQELTFAQHHICFFLLMVRFVKKRGVKITSLFCCIISTFAKITQAGKGELSKITDFQRTRLWKWRWIIV